MKVTQLPYIGPRKPRKQEPLVSCVKWKEGDRIQFRWFKRDASAVQFLNKLIDGGIHATITQPTAK
jgi:hypothetical protein